MVKRKRESIATEAIWITKKSKKRFLDLRVVADTHENVIARLLDFWDESHEGEKIKDEAEREVLGQL